MRTAKWMIVVWAVASVMTCRAQDDRERLLQEAVLAERAGKIEAAETAYCALAKLDKDAYSAKCQLYGDAANKERQKDLGRLDEAKKAVVAHDFDRGRQLFHNVRTERAAAEAQDWLDNKLPAAERDWLQQQQEARRKQQMADNIARAKAAMGNHDFSIARNLLASTDSSEARALLVQVNDEEARVQLQNQVDQLVHSGDESFSRGRFAEALSSYKKAGAVGGATAPTDLQAKVDAAQAKVQAALNANISGQVLDNNRQGVYGATVLVDGGSSGFKQSSYTNASGAFQIGGVPPGSYRIIARKDGRDLDSRSVTLSAAESASVTLLSDSSATSGQQSSDVGTLVHAIAAFYRATPEDLRQAEWLLQGYVARDKTMALSEFYLGAARLSRYYLAASSGQEQELYRSALDSFRRAKADHDFKPPADISPRILRVYEESALNPGPSLRENGQSRR